MRISRFIKLGALCGALALALAAAPAHAADENPPFVQTNNGRETGTFDCGGTDGTYAVDVQYGWSTDPDFVPEGRADLVRAVGRITMGSNMLAVQVDSLRIRSDRQVVHDFKVSKELYNPADPLNSRADFNPDRSSITGYSDWMDRDSVDNYPGPTYGDDGLQGGDTFTFDGRSDVSGRAFFSARCSDGSLPRFTQATDTSSPPRG